MHRIEEQAERGEQLTLLGSFGLAAANRLRWPRPASASLALLALHDRALHRSFLAATLRLEVRGHDRVSGSAADIPRSSALPRSGDKRRTWLGVGAYAKSRPSGRGVRSGYRLCGEIALWQRALGVMRPRAPPPWA